MSSDAKKIAKPSSFGQPGPIARMKSLLDGNLSAAVMLYRIYGRFNFSKNI